MLRDNLESGPLDIQTTVTASSPTTDIDSFPLASFYGAMWFFTLRRGTTVARSGIIIGAWDASGNIGQTYVQTDDEGMTGYGVGNSSDLSFSVVLDGSNIVLRATTTNTYTIRIRRLSN